MPTPPYSPGTPLQASAIHQLQTTVDELLPHQQRLSLQMAPGWLQLALLVAREGIHHQWNDADHPGLHLLKAMKDVGNHFAVQGEAGEEAYVAWHSIRPDQHLLRVGFSALNSALNALGLSTLPASVITPKLPNPQTHPNAQHYVASTELALRWLDASAAHTVAHPDAPAWALPRTLDAGPACTESSVRVLLQAGSGGAVAVLRVRAVHKPSAHLLLAPMPASLCLLLDASFGQALNTVTQFLRHTLAQAGSPPPGLPGLIDVALAWDLAPPLGEDTPLSAIEGDSAGAAFACAALLALAPYAPPVLQASLWAARPLMGEAFMTAAIGPQGDLRHVGGLQGKASALQPLAQALTAWAKRRNPGRAASHPIYLAPGQPGRHQLPPEFQPEEPPTVADLLQRIAQRARPSSPAHEAALALVLKHPNDLAAAASALSAPEHKGTAERLRTAPLSHWSHLAVRDLVRWEHQGGPLQAEFVPLTISGQSGGAWGGGRYTGLVQLLSELDERLNPTAFALEGPPGAGKTTLLRHHMQWLCHQALHAQAPDPSATAPARPMVLPMYLSLADWADTEVPAAHCSKHARSEWFKQFVQVQVQRQLTEEHWSHALLDSLHETDTPQPWVWRWLIDGLNELPHPANETRAERARAIVAALKAHYGMRLPMLLSVREDHMSSTDWVWVRVEAWSDEDRADYLRKRFAPLEQQQPGSAQTTTEKVQTLLQALPESSRALYTRPMALAMLCDVYLASPEQGLPPHRAALYTAFLWFLLRRELGHTRHTPRNPALFQNSALLSATDRDWIEAADTWPASPDELPQQGLLLRGLLDQAEHQYWGELDRGEKQDQRCRVAVPLHQVQVFDEKGMEVEPALRKQWLQAVEVLGLADPADQRKVMFRFSHQSWGEFLASVRLLRGTPDALATARARGDAAAQARWRRIFEQTRAPEAGRADDDGRVPVLGAEAELQAMGQAVADAWGAVPPAVWQRLLKQGLTAPLDEVILDLSSDKANPVSETVFWNWASRLNTPLVNNPARPDPRADLIWPDGLGGLHLHPGRWAPVYGVTNRCGTDWSAHATGWQVWYRTLWAPFQRAFDRWLRAQPELAGDPGAERVKALLASQGRLGLPPPADTREVLTLALCAQPPERAAAWLAALIAQGDWRAAVPAALLLRPLLEAAKPGLPVNEGHWFDEPRHRHPVLQHLRRLLLLRAVDAGAAVRQRLRRGGVLVALAQPVQGLDEAYPALAAHWRSAWAQAFAPGPGVDLRERLQAGLWLGELGDNLRYLRWAVSASAPGGATEGATDDAREGAAGRVGICLHPRHWRGPGRPGQRLRYRIGDDHGKWSVAMPEWTVELPAARLAAYPVTVMEYAALAGQPLPPELQRTPSGLIDADSNNPLQPVTGISWKESMALTDWYRPVYADLIKRRKLWRWQAAGYTLELPTDVQREAWARGPARASQPQAAYTHSTSADDPPPPLLFNHHATGWQRPNPVGVFSRGLNPWGLDDLAGNVWNWCCNAFPRGTDYREPHRAGLQQPLSAQELQTRLDKGETVLLALRGGSFNSAAGGALAAYRNLNQPDYGLSYIGLRWQMSRPISEP